MKPIRILCLGLVLWWGAAVGYAAEDSKFWEDLPKRADAWKKGEPIPPELLEYRSSHQEGACFPDPRGTYSIFAGLTNYALLREISFTPKIDDRVFTNAVNNAIRLGGPTRFFADLTAFRAENPNLSKLKRIKALQKQASLKHIVVDIIFIDFVDMAPDAAMQALQSMKAELQGGKAFTSVYEKFSTAFEYPIQQKLSDGTLIKGTRTKVGNGGDSVLPANGKELFAYREDYVPKKHLKKLFAAKAGDVLILYDKEDLRNYPERKDTGERYVLHYVREVYRGQ